MANSLKIKVGFNNVSKIGGGNEAAYGFVANAENQPSANTNVTISGPRDLGLSSLDPDKRYILTLEEIPVTVA